MKEFMITVTSERPPDPLEAFNLMPAAGPSRDDPPGEKKGKQISSVTLSARLVDVEYSEAQVLLEKMKEDARKS